LDLVSFLFKIISNIFLRICKTKSLALNFYHPCVLDIFEQLQVLKGRSIDVGNQNI
jgi:hypothetical protein